MREKLESFLVLMFILFAITAAGSGIILIVNMTYKTVFK